MAKAEARSGQEKAGRTAGRDALAGKHSSRGAAGERRQGHTEGCRSHNVTVPCIWDAAMPQEPLGLLEGPQVRRKH